MVELLLNKDYKVNIESRNITGMTALMIGMPSI